MIKPKHSIDKNQIPSIGIDSEISNDANRDYSYLLRFVSYLYCSVETVFVYKSSEMETQCRNLIWNVPVLFHQNMISIFNGLDNNINIFYSTKSVNYYHHFINFLNQNYDQKQFPVIISPTTFKLFDNECNRAE